MQVIVIVFIFIQIGKHRIEKLLPDALLATKEVNNWKYLGRELGVSDLISENSNEGSYILKEWIMNDKEASLNKLKRAMTNVYGNLLLIS